MKVKLLFYYFVGLKESLIRSWGRTLDYLRKKKFGKKWSKMFSSSIQHFGLKRQSCFEMILQIVGDPWPFLW